MRPPGKSTFPNSNIIEEDTQILIIEDGLNISETVETWIDGKKLFPPDGQFTLIKGNHIDPKKLGSTKNQVDVVFWGLDQVSVKKWIGQIKSIKRLMPIYVVVKKESYSNMVEAFGWEMVIIEEELTPTLFSHLLFLSKKQKSLETDLQQTKIADKIKLNFLGGLSHEIRTPMTGVLGMINLLLDTQLTEEQLDYLETIRESGDSLMQALNEILDFSKIEAGELQVENQAFELRSLVESAMEILGPKAAENQVELSYRISSHVPARIIAPEGRLRQVLVNLLSYAVKYGQNGEVWVQIDCEGKLEPLISLEVSIFNSGPNIPLETIDALFAEYYRKEPLHYSPVEGKNLGLAISKRLIEKMGGQIWAENDSLPNGCTKFVFNITARQDNSGEGRLQRKSFQPVMRDKPVLILAEKPQFIKYLVSNLSFWGLVPTLVKNMEEVNTFIHPGTQIKAALVDGQYFEANKWDQTSALVHPFKLLKIPVILMNYNKNQEDLTDDPLVFYLNKPVKMAALYEILRNIFTGRSGDKKQKTSVAPFTNQPGEIFPLKILLVEDTFINQKVVITLLNKLGYQADLAISEIKAFEMIQKNDYDMIILDIVLPDMKGEGLTYRIRSELAIEKQPYIVSLTTGNYDEENNRVISGGVDGYLSKPIQINPLRQIFRKATQKIKEPTFPEKNNRDVEYEPVVNNPLAIDRKALTLFWAGLGGEADKMQAELIKMFLQTAPERLKRLYQVLKLNDSDSIYHLAHGLKAEGKPFGAKHFSKICKELENMAKEHDLTKAPALFAELEAEYQKVAIELGEILLEFTK